MTDATDALMQNREKSELFRVGRRPEYGQVPQWLYSSVLCCQESSAVFGSRLRPHPQNNCRDCRTGEIIEQFETAASSGL